VNAPFTVIANAEGGASGDILIQTDGSIDGFINVGDVSGTYSFFQAGSGGGNGILQLGDTRGYWTDILSIPEGFQMTSADGTGVSPNITFLNYTTANQQLTISNPTRITGPSGDGIPYDTIYNPLPAPSNPPVPIITSPTAPVSIASWADNLAPEGNTPYTVPATGLYLVTASVRIGVGVTYSFPAGSILNLTPSVSGTQDPYNSMTFFLSSTAPQGNINTTQSGLGFYLQGSTIVGTLNQASTGSINLGSGGSAEILIQQVINQYP
jgi:hypothetical protein